MRFENGLYHEPGIYFGMPDTEYHEDWSIGSSDLIKLLQSPLEYYWNCRANIHRRPEKVTPAMQYGKAIHKAVLEGHDAFHEIYGLKAPPPRAGALITVEDLKKRCSFLGLPTSGNKPDLIKRIRTIDVESIIHEEDLEAHKKTVEGKVLLDEEDYAEILLSVQHIRANPSLKSAFVGGYPEVSIFWEVGGVPFRARFDYWKPKAIVDLKSTRNAMSLPWPQAVTNFLARGNYYIQATHYMSGRQYAAKFLREGKVFGDHNPDWLKAALEEPEVPFIFVVYKAEGAPLVYPVSFTSEEPDYARAITEIADAVEQYKQGFETYGQSDWVDDQGIQVYSNLPWPMWRAGAV
jgi:hypothetical protein